MKYENLIGKVIKIIEMEGEPAYSGKVGVIEFVDDAGQLHGSWGGLAIQPESDTFEVIS